MTINKSKDVFIKNIPLSYLKQQDSNFLESEEIANAVRVFDKYKKPVSDGSSIENLKEKHTLYPFNELSRLIMNKFFDREHVVENEDQENDLIFIQMSGLTAFKGSELKVRRYITHTTNAIKPSKTVFKVSNLNDNILFNHQKTATKEKPYKGRSFIEHLLAPEKTNNVLADVRNKSLFYDKVLDRQVYDDVEYANQVLQTELKNEGFDISALSTPFPILQSKMEKTFDVYNREFIKHMKDHLIFKIQSKYFGFHEYNGLNKNTPLEETDVKQELLVSSLHLGRNKFPLEVYRENLVNSDRIEVNHKLKNTKFIPLICSKATGEILNDKITSLTTNDGVTTITFDEPITAVVNLIYDKYVNDRIESFSLREYYREYFKYKQIDRYRIERQGNDRIDLYLRNYNLGFGLVEIWADDEKHKTLPSSVTFTKEKVTIEFASGTSGSIFFVYVLPIHKILTNLATFTMTQDNYLDILTLINPLDEDVKIWRLQK